MSENNYEEYLANFARQNENENNPKSTPNQTYNNQNINVSNNTQNTNGYIGFDARSLPCGEHYPNGTIVYIRGAETEELQSYSLVDDTNMYDIIDKMNNILASCVRIKYSDGSYGSYLDLKDGDRYFLIYEIRDITFPNKNDLYVPITCKCDKTINTPIKRDNMVFFKTDTDLIDFFDENEKLFVFDTTFDKIIKIGLPSVGIQKSFYSYLIDKTTNSKNKKIAKDEIAFIKTIPYLVHNKKTLTNEEIDEQILKFKKMDKEEFLFIDEVIKKMKYGIYMLKNTCECGLEAQNEFTFPYGASRIFTVEDVFSRFIKRKQ